MKSTDKVIVIEKDKTSIQDSTETTLLKDKTLPFYQKLNPK